MDEEMTDIIKFYKKDDEYGFMSNFYRAEIVMYGEKYATSEHYYQSMKFLRHPELEKWVATAPTPHLAFKASRAIGMELMREDWDEVKLDVMLDVVREKFYQHPELAKQLLETGDAKLIEDSKVDSYWGCGADGTGKNMLGKILMQIREELKIMKRCLIVIDYQNDFVKENGKLPCGEDARKIEPYIKQKVDEYIKNGDMVIFTLDTHDENAYKNSVEATLFPIHCVLGTEGSKLYGDFENCIDNKNVVFIPKYKYASKYLTDLIKSYYNDAEVTLVGLDMSFCVFQNALMLFNFTDAKIIVDSKGCASFDKEKSGWAINYLKGIGITVL